MAGNSEDGKALVPAERGNTALAVGYAAQRRRRAFIGEVFDRVTKRQDFRDKLEKQALEDPKGFLSWMGAQLPADPSAAPAQASLNVGALFLQAARNFAPAAAPLPELGDVLDVEAVAVEQPGDDW